VAKLYTYLMPTRSLKPLDETEIIWEGYIGAESSVMDKNKAALIDQLFEKMGEDYAKHTYVRRNKSTALTPTRKPSIYTVLSGGDMQLNQKLPSSTPEQIIEWRQAAEGGIAAAQYKLGVMYATSQGEPKDDVVAYMWCNLAAAQGNEEARGLKGTLADRMTKEQIAEAQKLSREWLAKRSK
jgi:TPR repeat protein